LGNQGGNGNNVIRATLAGANGASVSFTASARVPGNPANTTISGVVLDNSDNPIPNVTIRLYQTNQGNNNNLPLQIGTPALTDARGAFVLRNAPFGYFKLMADGGTAGGNKAYPTLEYSISTVAGQDNTLGMPIYLPPLDTVNKLCVDDSHGGTLTLPQAPGFALTVLPGSATFPGGSRTGCITVTTVNIEKVPMAPGFGQQPRFIVSIQPAGTIFSPPAPISLPNVEGLAARDVTEMYSYDHDLSMFVAIGTGTVSDDGSTIVSNPGVGVLKAGWHCGGDPKANGHVADCPACQICQGDKCIPNPNATQCNEADNVLYPVDKGRNNVQIVLDASCKGACQVANGSCAPSAAGFSFGLIRTAVEAALAKIFNSDPQTACIEDELRSNMQIRLLETGIHVQCNAEDIGECASVENSISADGTHMTPTNVLEINTAAMGKGCGSGSVPEPLPSVILHEMVHAYGLESGSPNLHYHNHTNRNNPADCRDRVYGCQESCFPGSTFSKGMGNPQACRLAAGQVTEKGDPGCNGSCFMTSDGEVCVSH
jgi:hypothetical protein